MKIGIDIHKTIDRFPKFFSVFTKRLIQNGHEVHIVTGSMQDEYTKQELKKFDIQYTHFFSVSDELFRREKKATWTSPRNPWFRNEDWNSTKAEYCLSAGIDLMIDDSDIYGLYFQTPYMRIESWED
jgi:hypothetical protein